MTHIDLWTRAVGRELDTTPLETDAYPKRIVACLNVWNDLKALEQTVPSWIKFVDAVMVVDGSYTTTGANSLSTDGTREYLSKFPNVTLIDRAGHDQCSKRTAYFDACREGDYCFIIDADERVLRPEHLRKLPRLDVGWVRIVSPLYSREYGQPRIVRWMEGLRYCKRHHWIYHREKVLCTHQYAGPGYEQRPIDLLLHNQRGLGRDRSRMSVKRVNLAEQIKHERVEHAMDTSKMSDAQVGGRESLQILNIAYRDDGIAPSRFHTALNRTTPHSSLFFKGRSGPFEVPSQYMLRDHSTKLQQATNTADILHYHVQMSRARVVQVQRPIVFHHHGSVFRANAPEYMAEAKRRNALVLLSNLELFSWTDGVEAHFLPNVVPVARYKALHHQLFDPGSSRFRVAHSPSQPHRKGTEAFLRVCAKLNGLGIPIDPVMIHDLPHRTSLELKATCHACFDSFWLGIQCSGLECAAMGLPVIAGDETVRARYLHYFGDVPYTFANNEEQLEHQLVELYRDKTYRLTEAHRVAEYVRLTHDEAPVALRYLDLLDQKFKWRSTPLLRSRSVLTRRGAVR